MNIQTYEELSTLADSLSVAGIAETKLFSCSPDETVADVLTRMNKSDIDLFPVSSEDDYTGYVKRTQLEHQSEDMTVGETPISPITVSDLIPLQSSLREALTLLATRRWLFCIEGNRVKGIVTQGDLQRLPAAMYFFAALTRFEAQMLDSILREFPTAQSLESQPKLRRVADRARAEMEKRKKRQEQPASYAECLTFGNKKDVLKLTRLWQDLQPRLTSLLDAAGVTEAPQTMLDYVHSLRNSVAHGDDMTNRLPKRWTDVLNCLTFMTVAGRALANA